MAKATPTEKMTAALEKILNDSGPAREHRAAKARAAELHAELRAVEAEARETEAESGLTVTGGRVHDGNVSKPLAEWRADRERSEAARALAEGRDPEPLHDPIDHLLELGERAELLREAIEVAKARAEELRGPFVQDVREKLLRPWAATVVEPAIEHLRAFGELADANGVLRQELREAGLPDTTIPGVPLTSFELRRDTTRANILLGQLERAAAGSD